MKVGQAEGWGSLPCVSAKERTTIWAQPTLETRESLGKPTWQIALVMENVQAASYSLWDTKRWNHETKCLWKSQAAWFLLPGLLDLLLPSSCQLFMYVCSLCSILETQASNHRAHCHHPSISYVPWSSPGRLQVWLHWQKQFFALLWQRHNVSDDAGMTMWIMTFVPLVLHCILQRLHESCRLHFALLGLSFGQTALVPGGVFAATVRTWTVLFLVAFSFSLATACTIFLTCQIC